MSTQKGNTHRTRPQKYQNRFVFNNKLYDTSNKTKKINSLNICAVCERCKKIIEWKIKYKKYKPLTVPGKCQKCEEKRVVHAYRAICNPCAISNLICSKCGKKLEPVAQGGKEKEIQLDNKIQEMLKILPERKRRTFERHMSKQAKWNNKSKENMDEESEPNDEASSEENSSIENYVLFNKLKSLIINDKEDENDSNNSDKTNNIVKD